MQKIKYLWRTDITPMNRNELEDLQFDCELKTNNLTTAFQSAKTNGFNNAWLLRNLLDCIKDGEKSLKNLLQYLENEEIQKHDDKVGH